MIRYQSQIKAETLSPPTTSVSLPSESLFNPRVLLPLCVLQVQRPSPPIHSSVVSISIPAAALSYPSFFQSHVLILLPSSFRDLHRLNPLRRHLHHHFRVPRRSRHPQHRQIRQSRRRLSLHRHDPRLLQRYALSYSPLCYRILCLRARTGSTAIFS
jgi:hypothetical protein